ncbi:MAG: hypothetical protein U0163_19995 [Gemmatimonadaceae bacterium]
MWRSLRVVERPIMMAGDHGVYSSPDSGNTWLLTGSNFGGLWPCRSVRSRDDSSLGHQRTRTCYATQDNDIKASKDGGQSWQGGMCCEGATVRADSRNPNAVDSPVTGRRCSGCQLFLAKPHIESPDPESFKNAPNGNPTDKADPPVQTIDSTYLQEIRGPTTFDYFVTHNLGTSWTKSFSTARAPIGPAQFAGPLDNPVAYIGVDRGGSFFSVTGLLRVQDINTTASVRRADSTGMQAMGLLHTDQSAYVVVGVDPGAPNHCSRPTSSTDR